MHQAIPCATEVEGSSRFMHDLAASILKIRFRPIRDFFPESSLFSPKLQQNILNCGCEDLLEFALNDPVTGHFEPYSFSELAP